MVEADLGHDEVDWGTLEPDLGPIEIDMGTPVLDLGTPVVDMGSPVVDMGSPIVDMGSPVVDSGTECAPHSVPHYADTYCTDSTLTCVRGCTTDACTYDCLAADPDPNCAACFNSDVVYCHYNNGCAAAHEDFWCCAEEHCPDSVSFDSCLMTHCPTQRDLLIGCNVRVDESGVCNGSALACWGM